MPAEDERLARTCNFVCAGFVRGLLVDGVGSMD
jgi:hypothetical protein